MKGNTDSIMPAVLPGPHEMNLNPLTLSFPGDIEDTFRTDFFKNSLKLVRISLFAGIVLYSLFGILDARLVPQMRISMWFVRFAIVLPCLAAVIVFTYSPKFEKYFQLSVASAMVISGFGIIMMISIIPSPASNGYYVGLILVFIWGYSFTRVRFVWATAAGWLIVVFYEIIAIYVKQTPYAVLVSNNFFFISANVIGMCVCYSIEYYARANFFINYLYEKEREKISSVNRRLEEIVENRTAQLVEVTRLLEEEQEKIKSVNRKLEEAVDERTSQLVKANEELREGLDERKRLEKEREELHSQLQRAQKLEAVGTLAGGVAHDFNNLLMGIQGTTSVVLARMDREDPNYKKLETAQGYIKQSAELAGQLLGFARGGKYELKVTDMRKLVDRTAKMFGRTRKEITIEKNFPGEIDQIDVDQNQIEQVLLNLFVNAAHAMPNGGTLTISAENVTLDEKTVELHRVPPGEYLKTSIKDTGIGMDKTTMEKVFDPFFTTKERGRGTGLGLASAYGIIKSHNGFFNVVSEVEKGSTFEFYLPIAERVKVEPVEEKNEEVVNGVEKILLVDDEEMIITEVGDMLETLGYNVTAARGGKEAIKLYEENKNEIDLVILDMIMPEMTGGQTFDYLKMIDPEVKVLLSSGYSIDGSAREIMERGCNGFIHKPFDLALLSKKIREVLDQQKVVYVSQMN